MTNLQHLVVESVVSRETNYDFIEFEDPQLIKLEMMNTCDYIYNLIQNDM